MNMPGYWNVVRVNNWRYGDPKSIEFCSKAGLNYVSCSPYRVPIARLAAAQAELKK